MLPHTRVRNEETQQLQQQNLIISFSFSFSFPVPPEYPLVLNRWGRQLNGTILGPMEEGDDIMLTCRVVGGKPRNKFNAFVWLRAIVQWSSAIYGCARPCYSL